MERKYTLFVLLVLMFSVQVRCQIDLADFFSNCKINEEGFDSCLRDGINNLRPYYKTGLPDYNIAPFDPFFAKEVAQKRSTPFFNYKLILRNVTESGWTASHINSLKCDFSKHQIQYTQFFPDKQLNGWYEIDGTFFGNKMSNSGTWNLSLYDYTQTTTVTRKPLRDQTGRLINNPPIKAKMNIQSCKRLQLHIGNLARGRTVIENFLDWVINTAWQPGFVVLSPLINDLVSTAFTEIFNNNFQNFPFDSIFPPN